MKEDFFTGTIFASLGLYLVFNHKKIARVANEQRKDFWSKKLHIIPESLYGETSVKIGGAAFLIGGIIFTIIGILYFF